jgi:hypothetical protein
MEYYLVEKSGEHRSVWGPYPSVAAATKNAGVRYAVVRGDGLANGQTLTRGALHNALQSRRVIVCDGSDAQFVA